MQLEKLFLFIQFKEVDFKGSAEYFLFFKGNGLPNKSGNLEDKVIFRLIGHFLLKTMIVDLFVVYIHLLVPVTRD